MTTIVIPNLQVLIPSYKRKEFFTRLTTLTQLAWQQALISQKAHRVFFDLEKRILRIEQEKKMEQPGQQPSFEATSISYVDTVYQWSDNIEIKQFYIYDEDQLARRGIKTEQIWFYVAPDGLAQPTIINLVDNTEKDAAGNSMQIGLVINPFNAHITRYEKFQKP